MLEAALAIPVVPGAGSVDFSDLDWPRRRRRQKKSSAAAAMTTRPTPTPMPAAAPLERLEDEVVLEAGTAVEEDEDVCEAPVEVGVVVAAAPVVDEDAVTLDVLEVDVLEALQVDATPGVETIKKCTLLKELDVVAGSTNNM